MVEAVAIVVGGNQLQDGELAPEWDGQVDAQTEAGGGGEGQPETGAVTSQTPHSFTGRHVVQHVCLQQARLLLHGAQQRCYFNETPHTCVVSQLYWRSEIRLTAPITDFEIRERNMDSCRKAVFLVLQTNLCFNTKGSPRERDEWMNGFIYLRSVNWMPPKSSGGIQLTLRNLRYFVLV